MKDTHGWISAHIFYEGDLDPLIVGMIGPFIDELTELGWSENFFFIRYWDGGPHLRLRIRPSEPGCAGKIIELLDQRAGRFLREHPSATTLTDAVYRRSVSQLGRWENVTPRSTRFPNNSVAYIPYERETTRYGTGTAIEAVERHFDVSSRLAMEVLRQGTTSTQRESLACAFMLLSGQRLRDHGLKSGDGRQRAENWRDLLTRDEIATAASLDELYQRQSTQIGALADRMRSVARQAANLPPQSMFARWISAIDSLLPVSGETPRHDVPDPAAVVDLCTHLACNRLGVRLEAEGSLRYLIGRAASLGEEHR